MHLKKYGMTVGRKIPVGKKHLALAVGFIMAAQAQGLEFYAGGVEANLNTQISMGSSWRVEKQNETLLGDPNIDNGNRNYQKNDAFSQIFKGRNDLQVSYENVGAIVSAKYWYDAALENDDALDDSDYADLAKFSGARIMDAYVYSEFELLDMPVDVRLGKQVVNWGESTFIPGGINNINSYDLSAFSRPGAKLKDAVIPVGLAFANVGLTDNLSAEVFYQLEFQETVLDGCGTYFSATDNFSEGCDGVEVLDATQTSTGEIALLNGRSNFVERPNSDGQFGVAFRYVSEALDTEFGLYAMNVHSRTPVVYGSVGSVNEAAIFDAAVVQGGLLGASLGLSGEELNTFATEVAVGATVEANAAASSFHLDYAEDVQIVGLSFATEVATMSVSGEISHQLDVPLNINDALSIAGIVAGQGVIAANGAGIQAATGGPGSTSDYIDAAIALLAASGTADEQFYAQQYATSRDGTTVDGFRLFDATQVQLTAIKLFDQTLGADSVYVVAEAGYTFIHSLDDSAGAIIKYEGSSDAVTNTVTQDSWGYRAIVGAEYSDVFAGVGLSPELFISHDVDGVAPLAVSGFNEDNKRIGLTLNATMSNDVTASVSYNRLTGGDNDRVSDRDFASISVGMQF